MNSPNLMGAKKIKHKGWVKISHWLIALSFLMLTYSGIEILMVHPRLYWGEAGNDLTPALFELPISRNYKHGGWDKSVPFFDGPGSPVSSSRTINIFNQNGWGRSLHFLSAWLLVITGLVYLITGIFSGHFRNHIWLKLKEFSPQMLWQDVIDHLRMRIHPATIGPQYGLLQKITYMFVIFIALPLVVFTGLTMSPAITATFPFLLELTGGYQSARTIHFFTSVILELFLFVHLIMIYKSGFKKNIRYMTLGKEYERK